MIDITEGKILSSIKWAIDEVEKLTYKSNSWNSFEFLIKEMALGMIDIGATIYLCEVGYNIDWDCRCSCCGDMAIMGSYDLKGKKHQSEEDSPDNSRVAIVTSISGLKKALGNNEPVIEDESKSPEEAAKLMYERIKNCKPCCTD